MRIQTLATCRSRQVTTIRSRLVLLTIFLAGWASGSVAFASDIGRVAPVSSIPSKLASLPDRHRVLPEALVRFDQSTAAEDDELHLALNAYERSGNPEQVEPILGFLKRYPASAWRQSLWLNLGDIYYQHGYFSEATDAWQRAWDAGKMATDTAQKIVIDQAVGELIRMHARLGHADAVQALLDEIGNRPIAGAATEAIQGAREGLWEMRNEPGVAYLCGPFALRSLLNLEDGAAGKQNLLDAARSSPRGFGLDEVAQLARQAGMSYRPMHRDQGDAIPVPSLVHWKVNHYAAIIGYESGRYHVADPTFGNDLWLTPSAINAETSGYFMVANERPGAGWRDVSLSEAKSVRGMGATTTQDPKATRPYDDKSCCSKNGGKGMPTYAVQSMVVSLSFEDTPVGYSPPRGPAVNFAVVYNQREASQPATFTFGNLGQKWTHNWLSYVTDDPAHVGTSVSVAVPGGGSETYSGYNSGTGAFKVESRLGATLVRTSASPITYERRFVDGSIHVFQKSDGATFYPRRIFLTTVKDSAGNSVSLGYDSQLRLVTLTDALGQVTTLSYSDPADPLHVTRVTDPFGRYATFAYDASGRMNQVTDAIGITSGFGYDAGTFINSLTTPYGTTSFAYTESGVNRTLLATDPLGHAENVEFRHAAPGIPSSESVVPTGLGLANTYLQYRNSFYWDKDAWAQAPGDYTKAVLHHFLHNASNTTITSPVLESSKRPGENRIWYTYAGQSSSNVTGTMDKPSAAARVLTPSGQPQVQQVQTWTYNSLGNPTQSIDPLGREVDYEYDTNNVDVLRVKRKNGANFDTLGQFTYNSQHRPLTYIDDAGQTTILTYNAAGQLATVTNPLSQVATYVYDTNGYLQQIKNANNLTQESYTYDSYGRVRTSTDSEGYALTFDYDALDRITKVTYPDATYEAYTYTNLDLTQSRDRLGRLTNYTYNAVRQLTQEDDPLPRTIRMDWSAGGRRTGLYDGENHVTHWEYDIVGRQTAVVYNDTTRKTYSYDLAGRLSTVTDALNQIKTYGYAVDDRPTSFAYTNAINPTAAVAYAYDAIYPRLNSMTDGLGVTTYTYGAVGSPGAQRVVREDGPLTGSSGYDVMVYAYDVLGRVSSRTIGAKLQNGNVVGGQVETITYDSLGRIATKANPVGGFTFSYLGQSDQIVKRTTAASGTLNTPAMLLTYDDNAHDRRLLQIRYASSDTYADSARLQDYNYGYDAINRLTLADESVYGSGGVQVTPQFWDVTHDAADRLLNYTQSSGSNPVPSYQYTYDKADNRGVSTLDGVTQTPTHNPLNQIATLNSATYTYDLNGNLLDDGATTYTWDAENRLISARTGFPAATNFTYDGIGRLEKTTKGGSTNTYLWCGATLCQWTSSGGAGTTTTEFDEGAYDGTKQYIYFRDQLGSSRQVRARNSTTVGSFNYGPYGEPLTSTGTFQPVLRYANMAYVATAGLYVTPTRVYNPQLGRWLSRDLIGASGGPNLYAFVEGKALGFVDPLGFDGTTYRPPVSPPSTPTRPPATPPGTTDRSPLGVVVDTCATSPLLCAITVAACTIPRNVGQSDASCSDDPRKERAECRSDDDENCYKRWEAEDSKCKLWASLGTRAVKACKDRAAHRRNLCYWNGGEIPPDAPPEWIPSNDYMH